MSKHIWVGFDLGGTKMLAVAFNQQMEAAGRKRRKTKAYEGAEAGLDRIVRTISDALDDAGAGTDALAGIGIGTPGPLDLKKGLVLDAPNLGWKNVHLKKHLAGAFGCPVVVANDVDAGLYAEYRFGAARNAHCALGVFPGTGIGAGCVYEGMLIQGTRHSCMEIGHIPLAPGGQLCGCGGRGCLETVASRLVISAQAAAAASRGQAPHLLERAGTDMANMRSRALAAAIEQGDTAVENIVRDAARWLGRGLAVAVNLMAPDTVVLGGGLVEAMPTLYLTEVEHAARALSLPSLRDTFALRAAEMGDDATATGAAAWARYMLDADRRPEA
ncbi:MAG: ROK family protein [Chitinivibrionales bacterium]|nr:ROK family protein [Chitinivibrionales bacterium]MBD3396290.1 ROK family protein [Chitinivibrionales bacterium]